VPSGEPFYLRSNKGKELQGNCLTLRQLLEEAPRPRDLRHRKLVRGFPNFRTRHWEPWIISRCDVSIVRASSKSAFKKF
jgi:hypothetical protein